MCLVVIFADHQAHECSFYAIKCTFTCAVVTNFDHRAHIATYCQIEKVKRLIYITLAILTMLATSGCQRIDEINDRLDNHEDRIAALEEQCRKLCSNIEALQTITEALQENDYVTKITCIEDDGQEIGYRMTFAKSGDVTVYTTPPRRYHSSVQSV